MKEFFKDWWEVVKLGVLFLLLSLGFGLFCVGIVCMFWEGVYAVMAIAGFLLLTGLIAYKKDSFY